MSIDTTITVTRNSLPFADGVAVQIDEKIR